MMKGMLAMKKKSERGSYTIEACISLLAFLFTIYTVYLQINTLVLENVLQKAVNNAAIEISCYSYVLGRIGIIPDHSDGDGMDQANAAFGAGKNAVEVTQTEIDNFKNKSGSIAEFVGGLFEDPHGMVDGVNNIGASIKDFLNELQAVDDWKAVGKTTLSYGLESAAKAGINGILSGFYDRRIQSGMYLPTTYDGFCHLYAIRDKDIHFKVVYMPDQNNNTVLVSVSCTVHPLIKIPGIEKRTVVKTAYSPLWL